MYYLRGLIRNIIFSLLCLWVTLSANPEAILDPTCTAGVEDIYISPGFQVMENGDLKINVTFKVGHLPFFAKKMIIDDGKGLWFRNVPFELNLKPGETTKKDFTIQLRKPIKFPMGVDFPLPSHMTFKFTEGNRTETQQYELDSVVMNAILRQAIISTQQAHNRQTPINILIAGIQGSTKTPWINTILHICDEPTNPMIVNRGRVALFDNATTLKVTAYKSRVCPLTLVDMPGVTQTFQLTPDLVSTLLDGVYANNWDIMAGVPHRPMKKECSWDKRADIVLLFMPYESFSDLKAIEDLINTWKVAVGTRDMVLLPVITKTDESFINADNQNTLDIDPTKIPEDVAVLQKILKDKGLPRSVPLVTYHMKNVPTVGRNYLAAMALLTALEIAVLKPEAPSFWNKINCCVSEQYIIHLNVYLNAVEFLFAGRYMAFAKLLREGGASIWVLVTLLGTFLGCKQLRGRLGDAWYLHNALVPVYCLIIATTIVTFLCGCSI